MWNPKLFSFEKQLCTNGSNGPYSYRLDLKKDFGILTRLSIDSKTVMFWRTVLAYEKIPLVEMPGRQKLKSYTEYARDYLLPVSDKYTCFTSLSAIKISVHVSRKFREWFPEILLRLISSPA